MSKRPPTAPQGLGTRARNLWNALHQTWTFSPDELEVLKLACEAVDRANRAQAEIRKHGVTIRDRFGQLKANPACDVRSAAEASAARLLRQLGFSAEAEQALRNARIEHGVIQAHKRRRGA